MATTAKSLAAHDKRFHGGHYEGGACKYREERGIPTAPANGDSDSANAPSAAEQYLEAVEKDMKGKKAEQLELNIEESKDRLFDGKIQDADWDTVKKMQELLPHGLRDDDDFGVTYRFINLDKVWMSAIVDSVQEVRYSDKITFAKALSQSSIVELPNSFRNRSSDMQTKTLLHEFGHCILYTHGLRTMKDCGKEWRTVLSSIQNDVEHLLDEMVGSEKIGIENNLYNQPLVRKKIRRWMDIYCDINEDGYIEEEMDIIADSIADMIAAGTHGKYGYGHSKKYFRSNRKCIHEFFAELCVLMAFCPGHIDKMFKRSKKALLDKVNKETK